MQKETIINLLIKVRKTGKETSKATKLVDNLIRVGMIAELKKMRVCEAIPAIESDRVEQISITQGANLVTVKPLA